MEWIPETTKKCRVCERDLPLKDFYPQRKTCIKCYNTINSKASRVSKAVDTRVEEIKKDVLAGVEGDLSETKLKMRELTQQLTTLTMTPSSRAATGLDYYAQICMEAVKTGNAPTEYIDLSQEREPLIVIKNNRQVVVLPSGEYALTRTQPIPKVQPESFLQTSTMGSSSKGVLTQEQLLRQQVLRNDFQKSSGNRL
jgi:hypothetical protein